MGIDTITEKIIKDAVKQADADIYESIQEAELIIAAGEKEAKEIERQMMEQASEEAAVIQHRKSSSADLEARKMRLEAKQKSIANLIDAALNELANMEEDEYISLLISKLGEIDIKKGNLLLNEKDKKAIGEKLVAEANKKIEGGEFLLSENTIDARGGFILQSGLLEMNSTLEMMVESIRETVTPKLVKAVFQE